jgi:3-oxoacyl-[acyl-carrier protein] reductase
MPLEFSLTSKIAIISGGSRGIGEAIVRLLYAHGATVIFTYKSSQEKAEAICASLGSRCEAYACDVSNAADVKIFFNKILGKYKTVDILINNAGITRDNLLIRMTEEQWDEVIANNLKSVFHCTKNALKPMMRSGGSIVHISSVVGMMGNAGQSNYAASKAAMIGFSKSIAQEYGSKNIRSNVIAPGYIRTDMTETLPPEKIETLLHHIPLHSLGTVQDVAYTALFLCSDMSKYVTGQVISVCGGLHL